MFVFFNVKSSGVLAVVSRLSLAPPISVESQCQIRSIAITTQLIDLGAL